MMRRILHPRIVVPAIGVLLILLWIAFTFAAEITVKRAFYDLLGMGDVYDLRLRWTLLLVAIGLAVAALLALPVVFVGRAMGGGDVRQARPRRPTGPLTEEEIERITRRLDVADLTELAQHDEPPPDAGAADEDRRRAMRWGARGGALVTFLLVAGVLAPGLAASRDRLLAALDAVPFGSEDPVFGRDIGFFVFTEPAIRDVVQVTSSALFLAGLGVLATGLSIWYSERQRGALLQSVAILDRTLRAGFLIGGAFLMCMAILLWLSRYTLTVGPGDVIAGAGAATLNIDIPTRAVGAVTLGVLAVGLVALSSRRLRQRMGITRVGTAVSLALGVWAATAVALVVVASPWWLVLALPLVAGAVVAFRGRGQAWGREDTPIWGVPVFCAASAILLSALGPVGALLNDAIVLRGTQLQVEQDNIQATLDATRKASGIDTANAVVADYRANGVTEKAVREAPASVDSLRFLDPGPALQACRRLQAKAQFYDCVDVDLDRYELGGRRRTVFAIGREIDYSKAPDFQRRHFTYTHGYGLILAPVNEIDPTSGRPRWVAGDIPQTGISPELTHPEIYFGAQPGMPWAVANTTQSVFDGLQNREDVTWCTGEDAARCGREGGTGIRIGSGWQRVAITQFLGGLPYIGGGRRVWNATSGSDRAPANQDSSLLLYRDIGARVAELAPFLTADSDPWFAAAQGRLWVLQNMYVSTDRYPYAARFNGINYQRQPVVAAMDAYSGETHLFVTDPREPMIATWRKVYPGLFTDGAQMDRIAPGLRAHLRYGEDLFDFQSQAAERFHVTDVNTFYNGAEAWAPTQERLGAGVEGTLEVSAARYTYAVLPGESRERFVLVRSFKPKAADRAIGFSGWLAVSSEPDDFGKLTLLNFQAARTQLESLDTFTANVGRDDELAEEINQRRDNILRGNALVVPVGKGLLYVQPLYLDSGGELPSLWRVVVGLGASGQVFSAPTFDAALGLALGSDDAAGDAGEGVTLAALLERAGAEFQAYRQAVGEGRFEEAGRRLATAQRLLERARVLARQQQQDRPGGSGG